MDPTQFDFVIGPTPPAEGSKWRPVLDSDSDSNSEYVPTLNIHLDDGTTMSLKKGAGFEVVLDSQGNLVPKLLPSSTHTGEVNSALASPVSVSKLSALPSLSASISEAGSAPESELASVHLESLSMYKEKDYCLSSLQAVTSKEDPLTMYKILDSIGKGSFGSVHTALPMGPHARRQTKLVAVKFIHLTDYLLQPNRSLLLVNEITITRSIRHPNIMRVLEAYLVGGKELIIVMELVEGSSLYKLGLHTDFTEKQIATICREVCKGLQHLHLNWIIHRDIKSPNIMIDFHGNVKIVDFGSSVRLTETTREAREFVGSLEFMAPEVFDGSYGSKIDCWSLGITAVEMSGVKLGRVDIKEAHEFAYELKTKGAPKMNRRNTSRHLRHFAAACLAIDPAKRATASKLLEHKLMKRASTTDCLIPLFDYRLNSDTS